MKYADVIVDITFDKLDKTYQYRIPEGKEGESIQIGSEVYIPFGKGNRRIRGFVTGLSKECKCPPERIKEIAGIADKSLVLESHLIQLAAWIRENFGGTMNEALRTVLPVSRAVRQKVERSIRLTCEKEAARQLLAEYQRKKYQAKERLLAELLHIADSPTDTPAIRYEVATGKLRLTAATLRSLEKDGVIAIESRTVYRTPLKSAQKEAPTIVLNEEQRAVAEDFAQEYRSGIRRPYLLHGITGSGKTEVYMAMIDTVLAEGKQVIFLIPEIALTYQIVDRFQRRFGSRVSILHSRMSAGERYDQYLRAKQGDTDIVIGPRSALFTPFPRLGLIVLDEEHEGSYKSEKAPKFHAREVALKRASMLSASVVLGSATPSLTATRMAEQGKCKGYRLSKRAGAGQLPEVHVVDLREEIKQKNRSIFSEELKRQIADRLEQKQQVMLFLNRRGYAGFVSCRSCGHVMKCPHCEVSLTYHKEGRLTCHYCGYEEQMPEQCPECSSPYIASFGIGTQKVEELAKKEFPNARVLRMDADTTSGKEGHGKILEAFAKGQADILVGTQMIVKGHDYERVTLVGILAADMSLYATDYMAAEKTFELLVQASGRAGRGRVPGTVVIQTYQPDHYSIRAAAKGDYDSFYEQELLFRTLGSYPPVIHILAVLFTGKKEEEVEQTAMALRSFLGTPEEVRIGSPVRAGIGKIKDIYRYVLYLKSASYEKLVFCKNRLEEEGRENPQYRTCSLQFDFNPSGSY